MESDRDGGASRAEAQERVLQALFCAIDDVNEMADPEQALEKSPKTMILGPMAVLDSMGYINLIAAVEERIELEFARKLGLVRVRGLAADGTMTVGSLASSIARILEESR